MKKLELAITSPEHTVVIKKTRNSYRINSWCEESVGWREDEFSFEIENDGLDRSIKHIKNLLKEGELK